MLSVETIWQEPSCSASLPRAFLGSHETPNFFDVVIGSVALFSESLSMTRQLSHRSDDRTMCQLEFPEVRKLGGTVSEETEIRHPIVCD